MNELVLTVVAGSLLGSLHCVGMCGGFVAFYSADTTRAASATGSHLAYNLGRFLIYVALGAAAGALGAAVNLAGNASGLGQIAAFVCGGLIIVSGAFMLATASGARWAKLPAPPFVNRLLGRVIARLRRAPPPVRAAVLGVSSALLPCGWLYGFVVTAAGSGTATTGAVIMAAFWLGTVPAMLGVGLGAQRFARALGPRLGLLMPTMLIVMGVLTVIHRGFGPGESPASAHAEPWAAMAAARGDARP